MKNSILFLSILLSSVMLSFAQETVNVKLYIYGQIPNHDGDNPTGKLMFVYGYDKDIPKTPDILRQTLLELVKFEPDHLGDSEYNGVLGMKLEGVKLNNGLASVYLKTNKTFTCQTTSKSVKYKNKFTIEQVEMTAKQFETVKTVKVFVNNKPCKFYSPK